MVGVTTRLPNFAIVFGAPHCNRPKQVSVRQFTPPVDAALLAVWRQHLARPCHPDDNREDATIMG